MTAHMEHFSAASNDDDNMMPRDREDFLSQNINRVKRVTDTYLDETETSYITDKHVTMHDGTWYKAHVTRPKQLVSDVANLRTPSWTISHKEGYERLYAEDVASLGITNISISPQQNIARFGNLEHDSHDYIEIAQYLAIENDLDPENITVGGGSRGADHTHAVAANAPSHRVNVVYSDAIAACMPNGVTLEHLPRQIAMLRHEPGALLRIIKQASLGELTTYARTFALNPHEQFQHAKEVPTLIWGSTGEHTRRIPRDSFGYSTQYIRDGLAFQDEWDEIYAQLPAMYHSRQPGSHLDCVAPLTRRRSINRLATVHEEIRPRIVGGQALYNAIVLDNPDFDDSWLYHYSSAA